MLLVKKFFYETLSNFFFLILALLEKLMLFFPLRFVGANCRTESGIFVFYLLQAPFYLICHADDLLLLVKLAGMLVIN